MTDEELAELARLELMARPGPLDVERRDIDCGYIDYIVHSAKGDFAWCRGELDHKAKANAALIAALRNAAPALIALARRALELESALDFLAQYQDRTRRVISAGHPDEVLVTARELGWPGLQSEGGKEQGEHG